MKVCLIRPPILVPRTNMTAIFSPPIGLAYLGGSLRSAGFDVELIDGLGEAIDGRHQDGEDCVLFGLSLPQVVERIPADAAVIGVSAGFSFEWPTCRKLVDLIRARFPAAYLIAGGEHATALPAESLAESGLDLIVLGEGEETIVEVARKYESGVRDVSDIDGIAYKTNGKIVVNPRRARIRNVDEIPEPSWDLVPLENYLERQLGFGVSLGRSMPVLASRGCPYQCTFCSSPQMWTTRWVARDPDLLLNELQYYQERYKVDNFDFYDLTAIVKKDWIVAFCRKIEERQMSFTWQLPSGTRTEVIDEEVAGLLVASGCRNLSYAPESGSPDTLKRIKKKVEPARMLSSLRASRRAGLNIKVNIMLGFPGETKKNVAETFRFIAALAISGAHDLSIWAFSPYPGSELFKAMFDAGKVKLNDAYYDGLRSYADASNTISHSEYLTNDQVKRLRFLGMAFFYALSWLVRPVRPFQIAWNVAHGKQTSRGEMALIEILSRFRLQSPKTS